MPRLTCNLILNPRDVEADTSVYAVVIGFALFVAPRSDTSENPTALLFTHQGSTANKQKNKIESLLGSVRIFK